MKEKALRAHLGVCLVIAEQSRCPRRKFGAVLVDPSYNAIVSTGYNGPPRGEEGLCGGAFCARDGLKPEHVTIARERDDDFDGVRLRITTEHGTEVVHQWEDDDGTFDSRRSALLAKYPPIQSGTRMEVGCHHAEANALANAMRRGIATEGTWLVVTGEPCLMCARFIHHGGVAKVLVVRGGYAGGDEGVQYLLRYGVEVVYVGGPQDPRSTS
jgi:dCMP deaminase